MKKILLPLLVMVIALSPLVPSYASYTLPVPVSTDPDPASVKAAVAAYKNLSKQERKAKIKEVRKELKAFKAAKKAGPEPSTNTILLVILAILLPPLAVYLHEGVINTKFWISLLLTLLFFLPGVIYALIVVLGDK